MKKVVIDTNVLVSGTFWTGASYRVLSLIDKDEINLVISSQITKEYARIINSSEILDKTTINQKTRIHSVNKLLQKAIIVEPKEHIDIIKEDKDDNKFIEAAISGFAGYIITNDKHILKLKEYKGIKILTSEDFLKEV